MTNARYGATFKVALLLIVIGSSSLATSPGAADTGQRERGWYVGIGGGLSRLTPDTGRSTLTLDDDRSRALIGWAGRDISRRFSLELGVAELGEATLSGDATIGYRAGSVGLLAHVLGDPRRIERRDGTSLYLRAGLSLIDNDSRLELEVADNTAVWAGAGVDWPVARAWGLRGELSSYDGDAQAAWIGIYARLRPAGARRPDRRPPVASVPDRDDARATAPAVPDSRPAPSVQRSEPRPRPVPESVPVPAPLPAPTPLPTPAPEPVRAVDCIAASNAEPQDQRGCALFAGVLDGVDFIGATARLTPMAERALDRLAARIGRHPGTVIELRAHVAPMLTEQAAQRLSRERALAVARHLAQAGVPVPQLRARAFGDSRPLTSASGGARNGRIEIGVVR